MRTTQCEQIVEYIDRFGSITTYEAFADIGITRLPARISDLKRCGYEFEKRTETGVNRFGRKVSYTRYSLVKQNG